MIASRRSRRLLGSPQMARRSAMSGCPEDLLHLLDRAYDLETAEPDWLLAVADAAEPFLGTGHGLAAFLAEPDGRLHTPRFTERVQLRPSHAQWFEALRQLPWEMMRRALEIAPVAYAVDRRGAVLNGHATMADAIAADQRGAPGAGGELRRGAAKGFDVSPYADSLDVVGLDPSGAAVVLLGIRRSLSKRPVSVREAAWLGRIGGHLASALRLRRTVGSRTALLDGTSPVFDGHARPLHEADETSKLGLSALRALVRRQLSTRSGSMSPVEILEHWRALVLGRYSVVEVFDSDGKRFVVARPNVPRGRAADRAPTLTEGERAVLAFFAAGASNKLIAYDLGLSPSTVSARLASAATKLGTRTHAELIARARDHTAGGRASDPAASARGRG